MGYYTHYRLEMEPNNTEAWVQIANSETFKNEVSFGSDGVCDEVVRWYEHEAHMVHLSKEYPEVLFTLHGEGEEPGNLWRKYFRNGRVQICKAQVHYDPCVL